jgi:hypothetical protein
MTSKWDFEIVLWGISEAKNAKTSQNSQFLSQISEIWPCHTLDLFDTGLGDM